MHIACFWQRALGVRFVFCFAEMRTNDIHITYYENDYVRYRIEQGTLYVVFKSGVAITLEKARVIVNDRLLIQEGNALVSLWNITNIRDIDKAARDYFANRGSMLLKASAIVHGNEKSALMAQFFIRVSKPRIPSATFENEAAALKFLEAYR